MGQAVEIDTTGTMGRGPSAACGLLAVLKAFGESFCKVSRLWRKLAVDYIYRHCLPVDPTPTP